MVGKHKFVPRVIAKYLEQNNLHGFVDFKSLQCGDDIADKVIEHCQKTVAFIQLVEPTSFVEPAAPTVNWCLREYDAFDAAASPVAPADGNRFFFVLAGGAALPQPPRMSPPYASWHARIARKLHIVIYDCAKPYEDLKSKVGQIAKQIIDARAIIVESLLASWP
jgi:hypothetical protein